LAGIVGTLMVLVLVILFPVFTVKSDQHKKLILRKKYSLFYILTFLSGARRQIFMVFAGFMMVEKFNYSVADISALYLINCVFNFFLGPKIGALIGRIGEKKALFIEYTGLILIFTGYAFASNKWFAASLYVLDHLFFAMAIALKTYFQKIANPADIAATTGVSFTINHISAVVIPVILGVIWMNSPSTVFLIGAGIAATSLILSRFIKI
jgi:predicted MFS family arabinose efflux permease